MERSAKAYIILALVSCLALAGCATGSEARFNGYWVNQEWESSR